MDLRRLLAVLIVMLTGGGLAGTAIQQLIDGVQGTPGIIIAGATLVLGGSFVVGGLGLYRTSVDSMHLLRVAGWNTLGVVVTIAVLGLVAAYQAATGGRITTPLLSGAIIVGVSAFAHVLIGFNDVRRIRAETVANQRQKAAVVNRLVRHDLRHTAQMLLGYGDRLQTDGGVDVAESGDTGQKVSDIGDELSDTQQRIKLVDRLLDTNEETEQTDLGPVLHDIETEVTPGGDGGTLQIEMDSPLSVGAGDRLGTALTEPIENGFEHGGDAPTVTVRCRQDGNRAKIEIPDDGPGIPDSERQIIGQNATETELNHSSGLGLWLAKWTVESYGGSLEISEQGPEDGGRVIVSLRAVSA